MRSTATLIAAFALVAAGCATPPVKLGGDPVDIGAVSKSYEAHVVAAGLSNPSCVTFSPSGALTICDSANGKVLVVKPGPLDAQGNAPQGSFGVLATGFDTEYWKVDAATGASRYRVGPLSCTWLGETRLAVTDGGKPDGQETVLFIGPNGTVGTNPVGPTSTDPADLGEGNLTGLSAMTADGRIFVCGQGSDAKTWLLVCDVASRTLEPFASAKDAGIQVNSPMQALLTTEGNVLVLYSGVGGKADGLIAEWDGRTGGLIAKWTVPGVVDPSGMAFVPGGSGDLAVVGNNWSLTRVNPGQLARVNLPKGGGKAQVTILATKLLGPVSCVFGPDDRLYVAELGKEFDSVFGRVIAVTGF